MSTSPGGSWWLLGLLVAPGAPSGSWWLLGLRAAPGGSWQLSLPDRLQIKTFQKQKHSKESPRLEA